ncbi:MAG: hypothetical protein MR051_07120, partial [Lentisphaeria bacterium]|nr:hypothetical protein [Lentisphaeria bacterium]
MSEIIEVNAIVSTGGTVTSVTIGETTYTGSASADLGTALTDNSTVVVTDYNWSGGKLTKQGITVIGGTAALLTGHTTAENGAALQTSGGTSYLSGLTFSNNRSTRTSPSQGGAYYNTAVATVSNTLFIGNTANRGGAVYAIGTLTVFNDCLFSGNTGTTHGGAINRYEATGSPLTRLVVIHGGTFSENASPAGGAVINTGRMEIGVSLTNGRDVLFEKNRGSAAVMNISSGTMSLGHATFDGNTNGAINNRDAGSVLIINGLITLKTAKDTFVNGGTAAVEGEAFLSDALRINKVVANAGGVTLPNFEVVAGDLGFTVTTAKLAGDLYVLQDGLTITPIVSAFGDVYQTVAGGTTFYGNGYSDLAAALAANSAVVVTGYTVSGATSTLFISGKTLIGGTGAVFSDNLIGGTNGGPLAVTNVALSGMTFSGNQGRNGGTLAVSGNSNILSGLVFSGNRAMNATSYGGAVYSNDGSGVFSNSVFIGNTATRGGAVSLGGGTNTFNDCVFSGNTGTSHGGAINRYGTGTQTGILLVIHGGTFSENASASGGAIVNSGRAEIGASLTDGKDALFEKNRGSAAIVNLGGATAAIGHAAFDGNTKGAIENRANGIAYINGLITLKSSADTIVNNGTITVDGAAFLTGETVVAKVIDTDFSGAFLGGTGTLNATTGYQNLKYANDLYVTLDEYTVAALLSDSLSVDTVATLTSGDVTYVGGVYDDLAAALAENGLAVLSDSTLHSGVQTLLTGGTARGLQNAVFTGNASSNGGAVRITGTAELSGLTFSGNSASGAGGALYTNGASVVSDSTFSGNTASRGGAFHLNGSTATFRDVNWFGNQAGTGGALQNNVSDKPEQEVRIYGGTFSGNSASNGAAIFNKCVLRIAKSETTGENVRFDGNLGSHAIVNDGGTIYLADAIFRDNANALNNVGGAVYISGSTFATAADGIYNNNGALEFSGSNILNAGISGSGSVDLASDAALVFDNTAEIGIIGLTFGGSNAVTFNGSEKVNFIKSGGQDLSGVAITVDGSAYAGSEIVVATGVSAIGSYTVTGADDLTLYTAGGKMVLSEVSNTMSGGTTANFVGGTSNLMTGGTVTAAFFGTRNNSGSVRTVFTGGTVVNSMVAGALVQAKDTANAALDTVSVDIYDGVSLLGGTANGGM